MSESQTGASKKEKYWLTLSSGQTFLRAWPVKELNVVVDFIVFLCSLAPCPQAGLCPPCGCKVLGAVPFLILIQ